MIPSTLFAIIATVTATAAQADAKSASEWQALARMDLESVHATIGAAHPGVIDRQNPAFNLWFESGYQQALQLVPSVADYQTLLSVVRFYTTGFRDGHLLYSDDKRSSEDTVSIDGWRITSKDGKYVVTQTADDWPVPLPTVDAEWLSCDGKSPRAILRTDVAPFVTRQNGPDQDELRAESLWIRFLPNREFHRCRFRDTSGSTVELPVAYRTLKTDAFFDLGMRKYANKHSSCDRHNAYSRIGDALWVRVGNFSFQDSCGDAKELDELLKKLAQQQGATTIIFDMRGNTGGDSSIGDRIFDAVTGGLQFDHTNIDRLPRTYAQWRVSEVLLATAERTVDNRISLYGPDSEQAKSAKRFLESVEQAKAKSQTWVEQPSGYRVTSADVAARHGVLQKFKGKLAIVTDGGCVSACLDFVDAAKQVPHVLQLGQTTGSDTVYIDTGSVRVPSGNHLVLPLKVWRNRLRANNQAYVPDVLLTANMHDDRAVQAETLAALAKKPSIDHGRRSTH